MAARAEGYRKNAEQCLRLAAQLKDPQHNPLPLNWPPRGWSLQNTREARPSTP
jgi:hypothetical protein